MLLAVVHWKDCCQKSNDMKLRSLLLVKVKDVVTFKSEEEIEKLGFRRIRNSNVSSWF
jgi:hypothetical protein